MRGFSESAAITKDVAMSAHRRGLCHPQRPPRQRVRSNVSESSNQARKSKFRTLGAPYITVPCGRDARPRGRHLEDVRRSVRYVFSMTRRIHAFRGAFRGTVFNLNGRPVVSLFRQAWLKKCGCYFKAVHYRKKSCDGLIGAFITTHAFCAADTVGIRQ
jgi:hypothetical protein